MPEFRREADVPRSEFLRRTGALGIAGATALGFPLLETRPVGAAPLPPAKEVIAAGGGATIKIGQVDSFSGVYAAAGTSQYTGLDAAFEIAMRKNNRIKYVIVKGDDVSKPATGVNECKRLIAQEKVDLLCGGVSSAVSLADSATAEEAGVLFLCIGSHDTNRKSIASASARRRRCRCSRTRLAHRSWGSARSGISLLPIMRSEPTDATASRKSCWRTAAKLWAKISIRSERPNTPRI
jgi:hypothetical protein